MANAKYRVTIEGDTVYEIVADNKEMAIDTALEYWNEFMPDIECENISKQNDEAIMLRANTLGGMDAYIVDILGDEDAMDMWNAVFPDDCDEERLMEIAKDEELFTDCVNRFAKIMRCGF